MMKNDEYYMSLALKEAEAAASEDEVPVGAVIVLSRARSGAEERRGSLARAHLRAPLPRGPGSGGPPPGGAPCGLPRLCEGRVIGKAHNQRERLKDPTAHAEMVAVTQAAAYLQNWRLTGCTIYVTIEPCAMCAGALVLARMERIVYGVPDPKGGACGSVFDIVNEPRLNHRVLVTPGVLAEDCGRVLSDFFKRRRAEKKDLWYG